MEKEKVMELKKAVLAKIGYNPTNITEADVSYEVERGCLTINTGRDGRDYLWYRDCEGLQEACMRIDTEEFIADEEIDELLVCRNI